MKHDYLWDRTGAVDAEVEALERALAGRRYRGSAPALPSGRPGAGPAVSAARRRLALTALAAGAALLAGYAVLRPEAEPSLAHTYGIETLAGSPRVERERAGRVGSGSAIETDAVSRARLVVGSIGSVVLEPGSRLVVETPGSRSDAGGAEHALYLERGTLFASIFAAPRLFQVGTPAGIAVDLGCIYRATVEPDGTTRLAVVSGQVAFEAASRRALVPAGAWTRARPGHGPAPPLRDDAPPELVRAVELLEAGATADLDSFEEALAAARHEDALTLWHLLLDPDARIRDRAYARLAVLEPPPLGLLPEALRARDADALEGWRRAMAWSW